MCHIGCWVGPRASQDVWEKIRISFPRPEFNPRFCSLQHSHCIDCAAPHPFYEQNKSIFMSVVEGWD